MNHWKLLASIALATVNSCAIAYSADYLQAGIAHYKAHEYQAARAAFARAVDQEPNSDVAHYYLANSLATTDRLSEAVREYKCALFLSKDATLKSYCSLALNRVEAAMASTPPHPSPQPSLDSQHITKALTDIQQESSSRLAQSSSEVQAAQQNLLNVQQRANQMRAAADQQATSMQNAMVRISTHSGTIWVPKYSQDEIDQTRHAAYQQAADLEQSDSFAANEQLMTARRRQAALTDAAESLESQLKASAAGSSYVHLLPQGTNLYVRNYLEEPDKVTPLIAYPMLLPDPSAGTGQHARSAGKLHDQSSQIQANKSVHAEIVPP